MCVCGRFVNVFGVVNVGDIDDAAVLPAIIAPLLRDISNKEYICSRHMSGYEGMSGDTTILRGIDAIVNRDQVAQGINLDEIERELVRETPVARSQAQADQVSRTISEMMERLSINPSDIPGGEAIVAARSTARSSPAYSSRAAYTTPTVINNMPPAWMQQSGGTADDDDGDDDMPYAGSPNVYGSAATASAGAALPSSRPLFSRAMPQPTGSNATAPSYMHPRQAQLDAESRERMEDEKASMLADVEELIHSLELDGKDLSRIRQPDQNSSYEEVEATLRLLQKKVDRTRCSTLAEEIIVFGAMAMEEIFNGEHQYLGYSPNLTGFHGIARSKLRRVRSETGQIASSILRDNAIGPSARLLMELVPAMVLHARNNSKQHGQPTMFDDSSMADTNDRLSR